VFLETTLHAIGIAEMFIKTMRYELQHVEYNTIVLLKLSIKRQQLSVVSNFSIETVTVAEAKYG
jgi:hypothetical protein